MALEFREIEKDYVPGSIPVDLCQLIREKAAKERKSHSALTTELLCSALKIDPARFGLSPVPQIRKARAAASA